MSSATNSCFWHVCKRGFEGLVYILLDEIPYQKAIADALKSFKLTWKLLSTAVKITKSKKTRAHAKNKSGKRPLDMLIVPFEFGSFENDSLARMLVDSGTTVTKADAAQVRVGSALSDLLCKAAGTTPKDPKPMDVDMEVEKIDPSDFANDLQKGTCCLQIRTRRGE